MVANPVYTKQIISISITSILAGNVPIDSNMPIPYPMNPAIILRGVGIVICPMGKWSEQAATN